MNSGKELILQYIKQPWRLAVIFKRLFLLVVVIIFAGALYWWAIKNFRWGENMVFSVIIVWIITAYFSLPKIHKFLSNIYLPNYFIGRVRTSDGLLADPVNLAVVGSRAQLVSVMEEAGWQEAEPISIKSSMKIISATVRRRSYPNAPVSSLFIFDKKQDLAFQKEVNGSPAKRHHVRFWKVPSGVYLPGGHKVDWVAASSYDDAVGVSRFTLQITHSIDGDVDAERDFTVNTMQKTGLVKHYQKINHFFSSYSHRNGGGHKYFTDGSMVFIELMGQEK